MNNLELLRQVKTYIAAGQFGAAIKPLEKLMTLIRFDYDAGIEKQRNGKAFNVLSKVRKELLDGELSEASYKTLKMTPPAKEEPQTEPKPEPKQEPKKREEPRPEDAAMQQKKELQFHWDDIPVITFEDIAGLDECKALVERRVLLPLTHPEMLKGYVNGGGGGVCLYGPPGTGKTMMAAAIANRIGAKFCSITPSDLLQNGNGNSERAIKELFAEARSFPCAVIYFDEMDSIAPKITRATAARQLRSEFLAQLQGVASYGEKKDNILFLICATNKPWDIDSAFLRPGRFGTKIYVGLPDEAARRYIVEHRLEKLSKLGVVEIRADIDIGFIVEKTNGFNCADIAHVLDNVEELSLTRAYKSGAKFLCHNDFAIVLKKSVSSVQADDIKRLDAWRQENDAPIRFDEDIPEENGDEPTGTSSLQSSAVTDDFFDSIGDIEGDKPSEK